MPYRTFLGWRFLERSRYTFRAMSADPEAGTKSPVEAAANALAAAIDADVLFFNAPIDPGPEDNLKDLCRNRRRRRNVFLILTTWGGDADSAYRIAKCLQSHYQRFTLCVAGQCKSAGTLVAIGAHELVFGMDGELGPLDVQMSKKDSIWEMQSGLTANASLIALQNRAALAFHDFFMSIENEIPGSITVATAAEIATKLTVGLFSPLYSQIDPLHVGEAARAMQVADYYGRLLVRGSKNVEPKQLNELISKYPSHAFAIDREEAAQIFKNVRQPSDEESQLIAQLGKFAVYPGPYNKPVVLALSDEPAPPITEQPVQIARTENGASKGEKNGKHRTRPGTTSNRVATDAGAEPIEGPPQ